MSLQFHQLSPPRVYLDWRKRVLGRILPWDLWKALRLEVKSLIVSPLRPVLRVKFRRAKHLWVNLGCGAYGKPGWTNVDIAKWPGINCVFDIRKGLPFANESVNGIFCEHAFEHLEYCNAVPELTSECSRVLVPGGVLRIIVPDAGRYLRAYCENNWNSFATLRTLDADRRDILGFQYSAKMELINVVFRQNEEHKWAYDFENLELVLKRFGFSEIHQQEFGKSIEPKLVLDRSIRASESLYVDARK